MNPKEQFEKFGAVHVKDVLAKDLMVYLTEALMFKAQLNKINGIKGDPQVPNAAAIISHDLLFDSLLERVWPAIEMIIGEEVIPTYSYARLYGNGDELKVHRDRPSCEISMTVQLARTHHYAWPIYMGNKRYDMAEGDGVIYKGCEIDHWRNVCDGPEGYLSGQVFLHYVKKNGQYAEYAGDKRYNHSLPFVQHRRLILENK